MTPAVTTTCTVEFEGTEASHPFEKRVLTLKPDTEQRVGRVGKKIPACFGETLLFDTRSISRKQAKLFFNKGKLFLVDLNSCHGTFVNGKAISVAASEDTTDQAAHAHTVKSGDIVRFGATRKASENGEVLAAIEGRLTVTIVSVERENEKDIDGTEMKKPQRESEPPFIPADGPQLVASEQERARKSASTKARLPRSGIRKWSMLQPAETCQKGTVTDSIDTTINGSQTVAPEEEKADAAQLNYYDRWQETEREFSDYRRQTLKAIVVCLLIAVLYHLIANGLEGTVISINRKHFRI